MKDMTRRVLIYDQDSVAAMQFETVCKQLGYEPIVAAQLNDALAAAKEQQPTIICSDLLMDEGLGFIWQARSVITRPSVPAVLTTYRHLTTEEHRTLYELRAELMHKPLLPQSIIKILLQLESHHLHVTDH